MADIITDAPKFGDEGLQSGNQEYTQSYLDTMGVPTEKAYLDSVFASNVASATKYTPPAPNADTMAALLSRGSVMPEGRDYYSAFKALQAGDIEGAVRLEEEEVKKAKLRDLKKGMEMALLQNDGAALQELANAYTTFQDTPKAQIPQITVPKLFTHHVERALDNVAAASPKVFNNNGPEWFDASKEQSERTAVWELVKAYSTEADKKAGWIGSSTRFISGLFLEPLFNQSTLRMAKKHFGVSGSMLGGIQDAVLGVRTALSTMEPADAKVALSSFVKDMRSNMGNASVRDFMQQVLAADAADLVYGKVGDWSAIADIVGVGSALKAGASQARLSRALKNTTGSQEVGKALTPNIITNTPNHAGSVKEAVDTSIAGTVDNVMPGGITGASTQMQKELWERTAATLEQLRLTASTSTRTVDEVNDAIAAVKAQMATTHDPTVYHMEISSTTQEGVGGVIFRQSDAGVPFHTVEAAKARYGADAVVVPAKGNVGYVVSDDVLEGMKKRLAELESALKNPPALVKNNPALVASREQYLKKRGRTRARRTLDDDAECYVSITGRLSREEDIRKAHAQAVAVGDYDTAATLADKLSKFSIQRTNAKSVFERDLWGKRVEFTRSADEGVQRGVVVETRYVEGRLGKGTVYRVDVDGKIRLVPASNIGKVYDGPSIVKASISDEFNDYAMGMGGADDSTMDYLARLEKLKDEVAAQGAEELADELDGILLEGDRLLDEAMSQNTSIDDLLLKDTAFKQRVLQWADDVEQYEDMLPASIYDEYTPVPEKTVTNSGGVSSISDRVDKRAQLLLDDLGQSLGIKDEVVVLTRDDLDALDLAESASLPANVRDRIAAKIDRKEANAVYLSAMDSGINRAVIILDKGAITSTRELTTLVHEFMHHFDDSVLRKVDTKDRAMLREAFEKWRASKGKESIKDFSDYYNRFRVLPHKETMAETLHNRFVNNEKFADWMTSFEEFWAEQATKALFNNGVPKNAMEKLFKKLVDGYKTAFVKAMQFFGKDYSKPEKFIQDYINKRITRNADLDDLVEGTFGAMLSPNYSIRASLSTDSLDEIARLREQIAEAEATKIAASEGYVVKQQYAQALPVTRGMKYTDEDIESSLFFAVDPKHGASELAVESRVVGIFKEARVRKLLSDFVKESVDPLNGKERAKLVKILQDGDGSYSGKAFGEEFDYPTLQGMLVDMSPDAAERITKAYYGYRTARNMMHHLKDVEAVRSLQRDGWISIRIGDRVGLHGKYADISTVGNKRVWDASEAKFVTVDDKLLAKWKATDNKRVVVLRNAEEFEGNKVRTIVVDSTKTHSQPITTAIPRREGEYSRIFTDHYFIKAVVNEMVDDAPTVSRYTINTATTKQSAEAYAKGFNKLLAASRAGRITPQMVEQALGKFARDAQKLADEFNAGSHANTDKLEINYNRQEAEYIRDYTDRGYRGTSLYSPRADRRITSIDGEDVVNTLGPLDSLAAEVTNVSRTVAITQWRDEHIQRWMNTFRDIIDPTVVGRTDAETFYNLKPEHFFGDKRKQFAARTHRYIMQQLGAKTMEEKFWEGASKVFSEKFLEGKFLGIPMETVGVKLRKAEVFQFLRTVNFHTMLGALNPAQLYVQANGMSTALILSPKHGLASAKSAGLYRIALMSDNPQVWEQVAKADKLSSLGMRDIQEFKDTVELIRRSGILDGINSTSLYNLEDGAHNIFSKSSRYVQEASGFFFNRGEEFSRLTAFDVARREWRVANPDADWMSDAAMKDIIVRMDDLTQNMTRANETVFQRGVLSLPFQFMQYNIKIGANIVGALVSRGSYRGFSKSDVAKLFMGHLVLYGAANNGLGMWAESGIAEHIKDAEEDTKLYITQGVIAGLMNSAYKAISGEELELAVGKRLSTFDWYTEMAKSLVSEDKSFVQVAMGASYGTMRNLGVIGDTISLWKRDPDVSPQDVLMGLQKIGIQQVTTLRNIEKAYIAYNVQNHIMSKEGSPLARLSDAEVFAQALGMPAAELADVNKIEAVRKNHFDVLRNLARNLNQMQVQAQVYLQQDKVEEFQEVHNSIRAIISTMPLSDWEFVQQELRDKVYPYDTKLEKAIATTFMYKVHDIKEPLIVNRNFRENKINEGQVPEDKMRIGK